MRRNLILALGATAFAVPSLSFAQLQSSIARIGLLWIDPGTLAHYLTALREGLRAQGWIEGKNIQIVERYRVKSYEQLADAAAELVREKVNVIVCYGSTATLAASKATSSIPIVMLTGSDPVTLGVIDSMSRPGRNVTGSTMLAAEINGKRLEILRQAVPSIRHIGVLFSNGTASIRTVSELEAIMSKLRLKVRPMEVRASDQIDQLLMTAKQAGVQGLVVVSGSLLSAHSRKIAAAVAKARLPAIYPSLDFVDEGGLMAYNANVVDQFRHLAVFIDRILKGAVPGDMPVEQPTRFELVINMKTAKAIGIPIPQSLLLRADAVIQ